MKKFKLAALLHCGVAPSIVGLALAFPALSFAQVTNESADPAIADQNIIVVTGSRITSPNRSSVSPISVVGERELKLSGANRAEDILNSLPQSFGAQSKGVSNGSDGTATANLRNLGETRTLVLVDGRRLPPGDPSRSAGDSIGSAADLNNVPAFLVKRVDVLTGGASAAYGADAVAGVVNFILDREFKGLKLDLQAGAYLHNNKNNVADIIAADPRNFQYPTGQAFDGANYDLGIAAGTDFADGAGHVVVYGTYHQQRPVLQAARDYSSCWFSSNGATTSQFDNLSCFGSRNSAVANFITNGGIGDTGDGSFIIRPGQTSGPFLSSDRYNFAPTNYYQRPDKRWNAGLMVNFDVSDAFQPYGDILYMKDKSLAQIAPSGTFGNIFTINCSNPMLDAAGNIATALGCSTFGPGSTETVDASIFKRNTEGGGRVDDLQHEAFRASLGAKGTLSSAWSYDSYVQYAKTKYTETYLNDFSFSRTRLALNACVDPTGAPVSDPACVPYNIFTTSTTIQPTSATGVTQAAINYVNTPGHKSGYTREFIASGVLNGQLGEYGIQSPLASTGVAVAVGAEYRKQTVKLNTDIRYATGDLLGQGGETKPAYGSFDVWELLAEVNVPLVQDKPGFQKLGLDLAYRYSYYSTVKETNTWKIGAVWQPLEGDIGSGIMFRGSINRAVRAPTIQDIYAPRQLGLNGSDDPCAGIGGDPNMLAACLNTARNDPNFLAHYPTLAFNPASQYNGQTAGSATAGTTLKPEVAITKTIGVVFAPRGALTGFSASVDYFNINLRDTIKTDGFDTIMSQCLNSGSNYYCDLIKRDPTNGSLWLGPGGYIIDPVYNSGHLKTSGLDFDVAYDFKTDGLGAFNIGFNGTYLIKNKIEVLNHLDNGSLQSAGYYECVGYYGDNCGAPAPDWRHKMRVTWAPSEQFSISANWRHLGGTKWEARDPSTVQPASFNNGANAPGPFDKIKSYNYFDLAVTANVAKNFEFRIGANNIFDQDPPVINGNDFSSSFVNGNTYPGTYDALGRYIFVALTAKY